MIKMIKEILAFILRLTGIPFFIREIFYRNKATIILYHDPKPEILRRHLDYMSKHYNFVSLKSLIDALQSRNWASIPPKSLVITFDDGHKGNYQLLEIFKDYNILPTIYLCTHIIDTNKHFWWTENAIRPRHLRRLTNRERLDFLKKEVGFTPDKVYPERQALNLKEIREMLPYVDFQSHGRYHPVLTSCTSEESLLEISESKKHLEKLLGRECEHFCYPMGEYAAREIEYVIKTGYRSGRACDCGWVRLDSDPYRLRITGVGDDASINVLCVQISGLVRCLKDLLLGRTKGLFSKIKTRKAG